MYTDVTAVLVLNIASSLSILFLLAVGLAIIFGLMGVVNLAHGQFIMLGTYTAFLTIKVGLNPWMSFIVAPLVLSVIGLIIERLLIRPLYGKIMESILATWGLALVLTQIVELIFGKEYKLVIAPIAKRTVSIIGIDYSVYRLIIMTFAILLIIALILIEHKTNLGSTVRAVIANPTLASILGVNIIRVYQMTFVVGSALAGLAGAVIAPIASISPNMGVIYIINSFLAVLVGTPGSLPGLIGSSALLGGTESIIGFLSNPVWGSIILIVIALIAMRMRIRK